MSKQLSADGVQRLAELPAVEDVLPRGAIAAAAAYGEDWCHPQQLKALRVMAKEIAPVRDFRDDERLLLNHDGETDHCQRYLDDERLRAVCGLSWFRRPGVSEAWTVYQRTPEGHLAWLVLEYRALRAEAEAAGEHAAELRKCLAAQMAEAGGAALIGDIG